MERTGNPHGKSMKAKNSHLNMGRKVNLLIDIRAKLDAGKGPGYEQWAKIFNLKEAAKTLNFLTENNLTDYDALVAQSKQAEKSFDAASRQIKRIEGRMAEIAQLKTHIIQYSKTREVYAAYKESRHKEKFRAEHAEELAQHEAAKRAFDALGGKPIPKVAQLSLEYAALLEDKQERYMEYKKLREDMIAYRTALQNVDRILGHQWERKERIQER